MTDAKRLPVIWVVFDGAIRSDFLSAHPSEQAARVHRGTSTGNPEIVAFEPVVGRCATCKHGKKGQVAHQSAIELFCVRVRRIKETDGFCDEHEPKEPGQ